MGYRIVYGPMPKTRKLRNYRAPRLRIMAAAFLLLFVLVVRQAWPDGAEILREYLLPGERSVTEAAFGEMVTDLQNGQSVGEAVTAFCKEIVKHGANAPD